MSRMQSHLQKLLDDTVLKSYILPVDGSGVRVLLRGL